MNTVENNQSNLQPLRILPIAFDDLLNITSKHLAKCLSSSDDDQPEQSQQQLEDFLFNLESMVFLDGEHRADSIMTRFLRWSGPGFTKRFFKKTIDLTESSFHDDLNFVTNQVETLLNLSHYKKLATEIVEKSLHHISYEKIFVRLQNIEFLNFYVRGSYMAEQSETMTRSMAKKMHAKEKWVSSILSPESVEVFEELTVIIGENIEQDEEEDIEVNDKDVVSPTQLNTQQMHRELHPYLQEESKKTVRPVAKRKRAIQRMVQEKMRQLQDKSLDQFMKERLVESKQLKRLHLLVYHHIPSTDLELLIPNAEISLGVKEYIQLCFAGTATIPALGKAIFTKSFRRMLMVFNPIFFGVYRIVYKMNIVKTEQKYSHARYMLKRLLARNAKAISHLVDDYENVLKREALLIITVLACHAKNPEGLTQTDLEKHCQEFIHENLQTDFEPDFSFSLKVLQHWGIVTCNANHNPPQFSLPALDELVSITSISRKNLKDKIWIET